MTDSEAKGFIKGKLDCMNKCGVFNKEDNISENDCDNCEYCYSQGNFGNQKEAFQMALQALEKQILKKIEIRKATNDDIESELRDFITVKGRICRCPSCRCCIHISKLKYCWECGQKLDWNDEE